MDASAPATSCSTWSTATWPATTTAGSGSPARGTDASPYYRVFNPITQGKKFDPDGTYVKRWVPELRDLDPRYVHEPWTAPGGVPEGYPEPVVDHAHERQVALDRYNATRT